MRFRIAVAAATLALLTAPAFAQTADNAPDGIQAAAVAAAADWFQIPPDRLSVFASDPREWTTSALGCPEPDRIYAQVITPGWLVGVQSDDNYVALVHTDDTGARAVVCEDPTEF